MRINEFEWDSWNIEHIARHAVRSQEVEEACYRKPLIKRSKDGLYIVYGQTFSGRYLFIVIKYDQGMIYTVTAREMTRSEQKMFHKYKGR